MVFFLCGVVNSVSFPRLRLNDSSPVFSSLRLIFFPRALRSTLQNIALLVSIHLTFFDVSEGFQGAPRVVETLLGLLDSVTVEQKDECLIELLFFFGIIMCLRSCRKGKVSCACDMQ